MNSTSKVVLVLSGTAALALALAKRRRIGVVAGDIVEVARAAKTSVKNIVEAVGGSLAASTVERAAKYNIPAVVEAYRGVVPFGAAMAIFEHESAFDPLVYNWCDKGSGCKRGSVHKGHATAGAPQVAKWSSPGDGGFEHDPHAVGLGQILDSIRLKQGGYGGFSLPYLNDLVDPEKNIRASLAGANANVKKYVAEYVTAAANPVAFATAVYATHAEGGFGASKILKWAAANGGVTLDVLKQYPGAIANRLSGLIAVGKRSLLWDAAKPQLVSGTVSGLRMLAALGLMTVDGGGIDDDGCADC